jgi:hypothetical protein
MTSYPMYPLYPFPISTTGRTFIWHPALSHSNPTFQLSWAAAARPHVWKLGSWLKKEKKKKRMMMITSCCRSCLLQNFQVSTTASEKLSLSMAIHMLRSNGFLMLHTCTLYQSKRLTLIQDSRFCLFLEDEKDKTLLLSCRHS